MKIVMFFKSGIFLFLLATLAHCEETPTPEASEPKEDNGVLVLTKDNFDATLAAKKFLLVEFYAPWCGHCKDLAPKYEEAARLLAGRTPPLAGYLAKVDATAEKELAEKYGVQGYPTLKFFRDGKLDSEYDGARTADGLVAFMAERADPNYKPPPTVAISLSAANFTETLEKNDYMLVEFFAPWCGHCKQLAPEYEKAAKQLIKEDPPIPLATVDATVESDLAAKYGVSGYPTLKLFRKGKPSDYKGPRDADGIVDYMIKNRKDAAIAVESMAELTKNMPSARPVIVGHFPDPDHALLKSFIDATNELRDDYVSLLTQSQEVVKKVGLRPASFAIVQPEMFGSKFEKENPIFDKADATVKEVTQFIEEKNLPLVGHFTYDTTKFYEVATSKRALCLVFYSVDFSFDYRKVTQRWRAKIADIANEFKDRVVFAVANDDEQEERLRSYGLGETGADMNVGCTNSAGVKFGMPEMDEFDADHITEFVNDVLAGKAKPFFKSQPVPARQTGPVTVLVADNFKKLVTESTNDVLIEFYAPWCGHCKKLEPVYAKMAKRLSHIKTLTIAKMDATANDVPPEYKVEAFPTLYFKPSGPNSSATKLQGGRTEPDMITAMAAQAGASRDALVAEQAKDTSAKEAAGKKVADDRAKEEL